VAGGAELCYQPPTSTTTDDLIPYSYSTQILPASAGDDPTGPKIIDVINVEMKI